MPVQPALSFQSSFLATFQTTTPLAKAPSAKAKDGALNHLQAAASIGVSPGLLNCYVAIYRSLGGQMPVQQGAAGFERRYAPELVAGFAKVRQQVREGADIRSAMAALQLQQDTKPSKKKRKEKLEHLLELNAHLSQQVSELRDELSAIKQQTVHPQADDPAEDSQDIAA
jgi:cell division protein FtsB